MTKAVATRAIQEMPEDFSIDAFIERLILLESFEEGRKQHKEGKVFTNLEVGQKLEKWLR